MMKKETISVAMCTYNGGRFVGAQLESIAAQTRAPDELVVCDDRSSDETTRVVEAFAAAAPFPVRLFVNERNLGSTRNFERAIGLCEGELIALSDQDDVWLPEKLERMEAEFVREPRVGLVFTDAEVVDENLQPLGSRLWDKIGFDREMRRRVSAHRALDVLLPGWTVTGATMAFRANLRALALDIPDDLPMIHDGWIAVVAAAAADVTFIEEPLIKYRQHAQQQIGAPGNDAPARQSVTGLEDVRDRLHRANSYRELISIGERVRARLAERCGAFDCADALAHLDARLNHLRARDEMPESRARRLRHVLRELLTWRYHLYSNGVASAIKDMFA
jgi:glycosyltransferase involved in cell wall biosynthesis